MSDSLPSNKDSKPKRLLLRSAVPTTTLITGCKEDPIVYANPKGGYYDAGLQDTGGDALLGPVDADAGDADASDGANDAAADARNSD